MFTAPKEENSLYHFFSEHRMAREIMDLNLSIKDSAEPRKECLDRVAIYISMITPALTKQTLCSTWVFKDSHLTIDRYIHHRASALSPSHATLNYSDQNNSNITHTIHVYFNKRGDFNGEIQQRTIEKIAGNPDIITIDALSESQKNIILSLVMRHQTILASILSYKSKMYMELCERYCQLDHQLAMCFENLSDFKQYTQAIDLTKNYIDVAEKKNRYSDERGKESTYFLRLVLERLQNNVAAPKLVHGRNKTLKEAEQTNLPPLSRMPPMANETIQPQHSEDEIKAAILNLVKNIQDLSSANSIDVLINRLPLIDELNDHLLNLELTYHSKNVRTFVNEQRQRLPLTTTIHDFFQTESLLGNLDNIQRLYEKIRLKINLIPILSQLFSAIEHPSDPILCEKQVKIVEFLYHQSELCQAYVLFQHRNVLCGQNIMMTCLVNAFVKDNWLAFQMHLKLGFSPNNRHVFTRQFSLTALQAVVSQFQRNPKLEYVQLLFEYGACVATPQTEKGQISTFSPPKGGSLAIPNLADMLQLNSMFKHRTEKNRTNAVKKLNKQGWAIEDESPYVEQETEIENYFNQVSTIDNVIELARLYWADEYPELLLLIAQHCDLELLLVETIAFLLASRKLVSFIVISDKGRVQFNGPELNAIIQRTSAIVSTDKPKTHRLTFSLDIYLNSEELSQTPIKKQNLLHSAVVLTERYERLLNEYTDDAKRELINKLSHEAQNKETDALRNGRKYDNSTARSIYIAFIASTYIDNPSSMDYRVTLGLVCRLAHHLALDESRRNESKQKFQQIIELVSMLPASIACDIKDRPFYKNITKSYGPEPVDHSSTTNQCPVGCPTLETQKIYALTEESMHDDDEEEKYPFAMCVMS